MSSQRYRGPRTQPSFDGSEVFTNLTPGTIADNQTYEAFRRRHERILEGEWMNLSYFQKIASGRRCSCWGNNTSPSSACRVCYKTGIVGGWLKRGTAQWILDPTTPDVVLNNVQVSPVQQDGPMVFELADDALFGEILALGDWQGCFGAVDALDRLYWAGDGEIGCFLRTPSHPTWTAITSDNVATVCSQPQRFDVRITMRRPNVNVAEPPLFSRLLLRIHRTSTDNTLVKANRPRGTHALALTELGIIDEWTSERWWLDATLENLTSDDWFLDRGQSVNWKVVDTDKFAPQNYLLGWDCTVRKVQSDEPIATFPT